MNLDFQVEKARELEDEQLLELIEKVTLLDKDEEFEYQVAKARELNA